MSCCISITNYPSATFESNKELWINVFVIHNECIVFRLSFKGCLKDLRGAFASFVRAITLITLSHVPQDTGNFSHPNFS